MGDDFTSSDQGNSSVIAKEIVMRLCEECDIPKNPCTAEGVKVSLLKTDEKADGVVLINSLPKTATGELQLDAAYASVETVLGDAQAQLKDGKLCFTLKGDESAVLRLTK